MGKMVKKRRLTSSSTPKARPRSPSSGDDIVHARDRFKGALQDLIPKSEDESESTDEDMDREISLKQKRPSAKKKSEKESGADSEETTSQRHPFIMKLFDRGVDLSQFTEDTPLYPICRAWIANQPHHSTTKLPKKKYMSPELKDSPEFHDVADDESDSELVRDTYKLPPPSPLPDPSRKMRVPEPLVNSETSFPTNPILRQDEEDPAEEPPSREELLQDNLNHWTKVRQSWLKASVENEARYKKSVRILTAIYNCAAKEF